MEFLQNIEIDWFTLLSAIWTIVLVPIGKAIYDWLKSKKLDKYANILYDEVVNAVKSVQNAIVDNVKGTEGWDEETQLYVKQLAITKTKQALSNSILKCLQQANNDLDEYIGNLIDTALFDIKNK